jgi:D-amino peptidase
MVTGDNKLCEEAREFFGEVETVAVKRYITRNSAQSRPLKEVYKDIESTARKAVKGIKNFKPKKLEGPYKMEVAFQNMILTDMAASRVPGVEALDSNTITYSSKEFLDVFKVFLNIS